MAARTFRVKKKHKWLLETRIIRRRLQVAKAEARLASHKARPALVVADRRPWVIVTPRIRGGAGEVTASRTSSLARVQMSGLTRGLSLLAASELMPKVLVARSRMGQPQ